MADRALKKGKEDFIKGRGETELQQRALAARDAALADITTWSSDDRRDITTVAAGQIIKVCPRCQTKYPRSSFLPGTPFA